MADLPVTEQRAQVNYLKRELQTGITMANLTITEWSLGKTLSAKRAEPADGVLFVQPARTFPPADVFGVFWTTEAKKLPRSARRESSFF